MMKLALFSASAATVLASNATDAPAGATTAAACVETPASVNNSAVTCAATTDSATPERADVKMTVGIPLTSAGMLKVDTNAKASAVANAAVVGSLTALKAQLTNFPAVTGICPDTAPTASSTVICMELSAAAVVEPTTMQPTWSTASLSFSPAARRLEEEDRQLSTPTAFKTTTEVTVSAQKSAICGGTGADCTQGFKKSAEDLAVEGSTALTGFETAVKTAFKNAVSSPAANMGTALTGVFTTITTAPSGATTALGSSNITFTDADIEKPTLATTYTDASTTSNAAAVTLGVMTLGAALLF